MHNPAYQELEQHAGLQQLSDIIGAGTQKLESADFTIPPTLRVEAEQDTRVRDPVFNMLIHPRIHQYLTRHSSTNALHAPTSPPPITEASTQSVRATLPSKAIRVNIVLMGSKKNNVKNASRKRIQCPIDAE